MYVQWTGTSDLKHQISIRDGVSGHMVCDAVAGQPLQIFEEYYFWTHIIVWKNTFINIVYWFTGNWSEEKSDVRCSPKRLERPRIHFAADAESEVTGHLVRAPTPYPKELRAMAKHARSFQQQHTRRASREVCVYHHYRSYKEMSFSTLHALLRLIFHW